ISIHSPYAGGDTPDSLKTPARNIFQSTPPMQGETCTIRRVHSNTTYFNPLPLCRGRPWGYSPTSRSIQSQSTPPMLRAPLFGFVGVMAGVISIHSPYAGGDIMAFTSVNLPG